MNKDPNQFASEMRAKGYTESTPGNWIKTPFHPPVAGEPEIIHAPVNQESELHDEIEAWCLSQHPRVKYIHARMDKRSTIAVGAPDFVLFLLGGRVLCVECKAKQGKLTPEQLAYHKELEMLGHHPIVVRSFEEFKIMVKPKSKP